MNKSYTYLIPLLNEYCGIDARYYIIIDNIFTVLDNPDTIGILYCNSNAASFKEYLEELQESYLFEDITYLDEHVLVQLQFPEEYLNEFNLYAEGKFSHFREEAKQLILNYLLTNHNTVDAENVRQVLYRDSALREILEYQLGCLLPEDAELSSVPNKLQESFAYTKEHLDASRQ